MNELRSPDPTLTERGNLLVRVNDMEYTPPRACLPMSDHADGGVVPAVHARWFAVPCRECFPDAPPPGHGRNRDPWPGRPGKWTIRPDLLWQVAS